MRPPLPPRCRHAQDAHRLLRRKDATELRLPRPERLVAGNPQRAHVGPLRARRHVRRAVGCEPGAWRIAFADDTDEFFHVLSGRIRITDEGGLAREFGPGEACVIPAGFNGVFEVLETVAKHYVFVKRGEMG